MADIEREVAELRQRVARLEGRLEFLYRHLGVTFVAESAPGDDPRIIEAVKRGDSLGAIKVYREIHRVGIDEARTAIDEIRGRLGL
jgi:ribosomal protein L7/L12